MSGVDRLALVSKVLLDTRFLELKRENERLKLSLFWVDHSIDTLKKIMGYANNRRGGPRCRCHVCVRTKRFRPTILDGYDEEEEEACKFGPWFEKIVEEHGLSFASSGHDNEHFPCESDREFYPRPDVSVHFLLIPFNMGPVTAWYSWLYGAKLWKAQTTEDAGLVKLAALFKHIREVHTEDFSVLDAHETDSD